MDASAAATATTAAGGMNGFSYIQTPAERTQATILCCSCGTPIAPNPAAMCAQCIQNTQDITQDIPKQTTIHYCKNCNRYLMPPHSWVPAELESRELLTLCLKRLRGLNKVRLVDASFIWTEPHSKRVKVKLTVQKEVFASTILQQVFVVEYVVAGQQCDDCCRIMAENTWRASVQVRQKVNHKRTFLFLEQLILKHNAHKETINIKEVRDGLDFFYSTRSNAIRMVEFLSAIAPCRSKASEQLISSDIQSGTANFKYSYSVEIVPVCKDDLICLPSKIAKSLGNISQLVLCSRIGNTVHLLDPNTLATGEVSPTAYWRTPFTSLSSSRELTEYYVIDVELSGTVRGKWALADVQVGRNSDDAVFWARSHLGNLLNPGDHVAGYDLTNVNFNNDEFEELSRRGRTGIPDVILVRKSYPNRRKANKQRQWKLKTLNKTAESELELKKAAQDKQDAEYETFLRDLEEDVELRGAVNLYKNNRPRSNSDVQMGDGNETAAEEEDDFPEIGLEELLDDLHIDDEQDAEEEDGADHMEQ
ncbi:ribosome-binding protein [Sorochytrium milnesiophthora]